MEEHDLTSIERLEEGEYLDPKMLIAQDPRARYITDVAHLSKGCSFGELSLLINKPRAADITTLTRAHLLVLSKTDFERSLAQIHKRQIQKKVSFIRTLPGFNKLSATFLTKLTEYYIHEKSIHQHQYLYQ